MRVTGAGDTDLLCVALRFILRRVSFRTQKNMAFPHVRKHCTRYWLIFDLIQEHLELYLKLALRTPLTQSGIIT